MLRQPDGGARSLLQRAGIATGPLAASVDAALKRAAARLGIKITHSAPGRPEGRGKIERFFGVVRQEFLVEIGDGDGITGLAQLNKLFTAWYETVYHTRPHSETGQPPIGRWLAGAPFPTPSPAQRRAAGGAGEDDVLHLAAAQRLGALLAHDPGQGVDDVRLARAVGTDTVYHTRPHSETGQPPIGRWLAGAPFPVPTPEQLREAFLRAEWRLVAKTATIKLFGGVYETDPVLAGRRVECVFDPFDLTRVQIRWHGKPYGLATPHHEPRAT